MRKLHIDQLTQGISGVTPIFGKFLWETVLFCLQKKGHVSGVILNISGNRKEKIALNWSGLLDNKVTTTYNDETELVEYAATAIAILLILELTDYTVLKRAQKGEKGDYWLGKKDENGIVVLDSLLEISGILQENKHNRLSKRFKEKEIQIKLSPYKSVSKNIIVVEFSSPKSKVQLT